MIIFLYTCASNNTFGNPSKFELKTNASANLSRGKGFFKKFNNFILLDRLFALINFLIAFFSGPLPAIINLNGILSLMVLSDFSKRMWFFDL